jgi:hypothetical protein
MAPFGRSSHHQVWSQAMVATPLLRGLLGLEVDAPARTLRFAPQLPAGWPGVEVGNVAVGAGRYDLRLERGASRTSVTLERRAGGSGDLERLVIAPAFPLDARLRSVTVDGRQVRADETDLGDVRRAEVVVERPGAVSTVVFEHEGGTDVFAQPEELEPGAASRGLRILRSRADAEALRLLVEGLPGRTYRIGVRTTRALGETEGVEVDRRDGGAELALRFDGPAGAYARREVAVPLR